MKEVKWNRKDLILEIVEKMVEGIIQTDPEYFEDYFFEREYDALASKGSNGELVNLATDLGLVNENERIVIV